ncbi:MAG: c(7)-type cytochrome triheme domain-containing protein, partial [Pseudomonadota bacterium]
IEDGYINPRTSFTEQDPDGMLVMDMDIMRVNTSIMPMVKFPHRAHTIWLDCDNCHRNNIIFKPQRYGTKINMFMVLNGEKCGQCHGAVSFPVTECYRCHSVKRTGIIR